VCFEKKHVFVSVLLQKKKISIFSMSVAKKIFAYKSHAWKAGPYRCYFLPVLDLVAAAAARVTRPARRVPVIPAAYRIQGGTDR
jgi:hypothetical protein